MSVCRESWERRKPEPVLAPAGEKRTKLYIFAPSFLMRITQLLKRKANNPPARRLKYEILAFIRTKSVEKLEITSIKRHRTAYLPEQSS
jgi:hypothetical protein